MILYDSAHPYYWCLQRSTTYLLCDVFWLTSGRTFCNPCHLLILHICGKKQTSAYTVSSESICSLSPLQNIAIKLALSFVAEARTRPSTTTPSSTSPACPSCGPLQWRCTTTRSLRASHAVRGLGRYSLSAFSGQLGLVLSEWLVGVL